ncbi:MAG: PASTA domain-containing protein [Faecalibacterium prausnitzii]
MPAPCWCRTIWGLAARVKQYSDQPAGTVLSQNPAAGTTAKLNSRVNVVVSAGAAPVQEPEQPGGDSTTSGD